MDGVTHVRDGQGTGTDLHDEAAAIAQLDAPVLDYERLGLPPEHAAAASGKCCVALTCCVCVWYCAITTKSHRHTNNERKGTAHYILVAVKPESTAHSHQCKEGTSEHQTLGAEAVEPALKVGQIRLLDKDAQD